MNTEALAVPPGQRRRAWRVMLAALLLVAGSATAAYKRHQGHEVTDDAQVEGRIVPVAARVTGQVWRVMVQDNQLVEAGELLVEIDPSDFAARRDAAQADLEVARAGLLSAEAQLELTQTGARAGLRQARGGLNEARSGAGAASAQVAEAEARVSEARARRELLIAELERTHSLHARGAATQAELDARQSALDQASATLRQAEARLLGAGAATQGNLGAVEAARGRLLMARGGRQQVAVAQAQVALAAARVRQAEAALRLMQQNLDYCHVRAPVRGVVSRRSVEVGNLVTPDRPLLALVPPDDLWVVANFKEDQLLAMRPGQGAMLRVDTYGGQRFPGVVDSVAGATGARFSLLPPDNASGNFVKVVQRVPVLIRFTPLPGVPLRPGLSVQATVFTTAPGAR